MRRRYLEGITQNLRLASMRPTRSTWLTKRTFQALYSGQYKFCQIQCQSNKLGEGNAFALGSILEASLILGEDKDLYRQIPELITKEPLGDQIVMRQQQSGLWMDDLSGQVSDYDTVLNAMLIGEISKWQGDKLS